MKKPLRHRAEISVFSYFTRFSKYSKWKSIHQLQLSIISGPCLVSSSYILSVLLRQLDRPIRRVHNRSILPSIRILLWPLLYHPCFTYIYLHTGQAIKLVKKWSTSYLQPFLSQKNPSQTFWEINWYRTRLTGVQLPEQEGSTTQMVAHSTSRNALHESR